MPRVYLTEKARKEGRLEDKWKKEDQAILARIGAYRAVSGKTVEEIGIMAGIRRGTMYNRMHNPGDLTLSEYRRLIEVIGHPGTI
jgi:hypothetical protein